MKMIIAGGLTLAVFLALHIPILKKKKFVILASYAIGMILFFIVYNIRTMDLIISTYHPFDQTLYQKEFLEEGGFPDAFLDLFLRGRTVYTPDDAYTVSEDVDINADDWEIYDSEGHYWLYHYYHAVNMWQYLGFCGSSIVKDDSLNGMILTDDQKGYFEDLGPANDMLRYTFVLTPYVGEWGNGFYHYWFYNTYIGDSRVYICPDDILDSEELVVIWQNDADVDTDSYYIASKQYFDEVIRR